MNITLVILIQDINQVYQKYILIRTKVHKNNVGNQIHNIYFYLT